MKTKLIQMKGDEFVKKILNGERDFSYIKLEEGFDFNKYEGFKDMQQYLKNKYLQGYPIILNFSDFSYVKAKNLYLPYLEGEKANFEKANLDYADFSKSSLKCANFEKANLINVDFYNANLEKINFERANLMGARLHNANLEKANLKNAILINARLHGARIRKGNLEGANLLEAIIDLADFEGANLNGTNFKNILAFGVINFKKTGLRKENFGKIKEYQREGIERMLKQAYC